MRTSSGIQIQRFLLASLLLAAHTSFAEDEPYQPPVSIAKVSHTFDVSADGSYRQVSEVDLRIETPQGISSEGVQRISYASSRETIDWIEAWVLQPDGTRIVIAPDSIRTQEEGTDGGYSSFSDTKYKVIIFPRVRVGSELHWKTESTVHTPLFKGQFFANYELPSVLEFAAWDVTINLPRGTPLYIEKRGVAGGLENHTAESDRYHFVYQRLSSIEPDEVAVADSDYADLLRVSTEPDAVSAGRLYQLGAGPKSVATDRIRELALQLTYGVSDEREKAKTLYTWVARNIRYVSVVLDSGGFVPHPAEEVLTKEYGDCKDHTALLQALLSAVGIESVPALINAEDSYRLATVGSFDPVNHVITYIPDLDLYVDSTARFAPFGTLPFVDTDKPVILTSLGRIGRTPRLRADQNVVDTQVSMLIHADGTIEGSSKATMTGDYERSSRSNRFADRASPADQIVKGMLSRVGETGTGTVTNADPEDINVPYWIEGHFQLDAVTNIPGHGALRVPVGLAPGILARFATNKPADRQRQSWPCISRTVHDHYAIQFPDTIAITSVPASTIYHDDQIDFRSSYTQIGRQVIVERSLVVNRRSQVCSVEDREHWRALNAKVQHDLRAQIFYQ
jgi:transglutaminase-like putative cysteine protease